MFTDQSLVHFDMQTSACGKQPPFCNSSQYYQSQILLNNRTLQQSNTQETYSNPNEQRHLMINSIKTKSRKKEKRSLALDFRQDF